MERFFNTVEQTIVAWLHDNICSALLTDVLYVILNYVRAKEQKKITCIDCESLIHLLHMNSITIQKHANELWKHLQCIINDYKAGIIKTEERNPEPFSDEDVIIISDDDEEIVETESEDETTDKHKCKHYKCCQKIGGKKSKKNLVLIKIIIQQKKKKH